MEVNCKLRQDIYSNKEFIELRERLNKEILRRAGFKWFDPLATPKVGEDKSSPLSFPESDVDRTYVDDLTYTINNPSEGSIERTRNIHYPKNGENPAGCPDEYISNEPATSAARFNVDELKNFIVGLSKIDDVNLFYGRDEKPGIAFRNTDGIDELLTKAESDKLNTVATAICRFYLSDGNLMMESYLEVTPRVTIEDDSLILTFNPGDESEIMKSFHFEVDENGYLILTDSQNIIYRKDDPNGGYVNQKNPQYPVTDYTVFYDIENGIYVLPSGESDGEEITNGEGLNTTNFYDDYGARPGDSDYHPYNRHTSKITRRNWYDQDDQRRERTTVIIQGGVDSSTFGVNPRNPNPGTPYKSKPAYRGVPGSCNGNCTGLCFQTCDNICGESCTSTCVYRCGEACTSTCGNVCTGCSSLCLSSCKTLCENISGYACVNAGAKAVHIETSGGTGGVPAKNTITSETYKCEGCSFSCQFYPNKKTDCWDAGCMSRCFTSCNSACSTSCLGGCIDNNNQNYGEYKSGIGRGCSSHCTINCIGACEGVCEGVCINTCWYACKQTCSDNCVWACTTDCGSGCSTGCTNGCKGCAHTCEDSCKGSAEGLGCAGCSNRGGCSSLCQNDCASNCLNQGCRSMCGTDSAGACVNNCRINCTSSSCTSKCENACSSACTTCVNECDLQCGMCSSICSASCGNDCAIICTVSCAHSCESDCLNSCTNGCSSCTNLCYSCVGRCIGICSVTCQAGCSSCTKTCGWWCDTSCNQRCFGSCDNMCLGTCLGNCSTSADSNTTRTSGPERGPISPGYPVQHPSNRLEEQESFRIIKET